MTDPITAGAAIGALVTLMGKWLNYDIEKRKLEQESKPTSQLDTEAQQGQKVLAEVQQGVQTHGTQREQQALTVFESDPELYRHALEKALGELAQQKPAFANLLTQLQQQAEQAGVQTSNITGTAKAKTNYGQQAGVNTSTMTQTFGEWPPKKREE
jgi:uncharacterized membrane-anchored protein YhcB (DUF1043 family)